MVWSASDTDVTMALTKGTSTSPSSVRTESNSPAAVCNTSATEPTGVPVGRHHLQAFELMVVELVGLLDRRQVRRVDEEKGAPQ